MPTITREEYANNIRKALEKIENDPYIRPDNRDTLKRFYRYMVANNYSPSRIYKYLVYLPQMARKLWMHFENASVEDIENIMVWLNSRTDISESTKVDFKTMLRTFYKWLNDGEYPKCVRWIRVDRSKATKNIIPEDLLTEEEVMRMIEASDNPRNKAFIAVLWETGARVGEMIDLRIKDVEDYRYGKKLMFHGKTGARKVDIISSVPYLQEWLAVHPRKNDRNAFVWVNTGNRNHGEQMRYPAIRKMLRETAEKAEIKKNVYPHLFRHSRATDMATEFTEFQLKQRFGWSMSSRVPAVYVHLSGKDMESDYAKLYGIEDPNEPKVPLMTPKKCPRCGASVEPTANFCPKCGMALDVQTSMKVEEGEKKLMNAFLNVDGEELRKAIELVSKMLDLAEKNPDVMKKV